MFCYKCGYKLNDDAVFCQKCGSRVRNHIENIGGPSQIPSNTTSELNHEALKIYLSDILSMECIKKQFITKLVNINRKLSQISKQFYKKMYTINESERKHWKLSMGTLYFHFLYQNGHYYVAVRDNYDGTDPVGYGTGLHKDSYYLSIDENYKWFSSLKPWTKTSAGYGSGLERIRNGMEARDIFLRCYEDFKNIADDGLINSRNTVSILEKNKKGITDELATVNKILKKAYDINIIPSQFRHNLYAIYYLHDFITTSNQSLTTALLHFDLNEIKVKLNKIIDQQQEIIIQQSIVMAQNQHMIEQNQMHLKKLANIENNTARAAIYSEIAANNAEACAWIGMANYIKS